METEQIKFWQGDFGKFYTDRNTFSRDEWDKFYVSNWGHTKLQMNADCLASVPRNSKILEVGCNVGLQLDGLQRMGYSNLYGVELQQYAVEKAKESTRGINIVQGSGFDIPFRSNWFDVVCTNGVLIHISPNDYDQFMGEMVRCSSRYIMGFEYYAESTRAISYRGSDGYLWKGDFAGEFIKRFPELKLVYKKLYPYVSNTEAGNVDCVYLLEKTK